MENVPIYVKVDKYKELLSALQAIESKLDSANKMIDKITTLKAEEDTQLRAWTDNLADVRSRLGRINEAFYK